MSGLILLSLLGCQHGVSGSYSSSHLPEWVAATVRFKDGGHGSAMVTLGDPRTPPELRYAPGLTVFDGQRLLKVESSSSAGDIGVQDLVDADRATAWLGVMDASAAVRSVHNGQLQVELGDELAWFDAKTGKRGSPPQDVLETHHFGPGQGFELVTREDDVVTLRLPMADKGLPLFHDVDAVVALSWITPNDASSKALKAADQLYKAVMPVYPVGEHALADGDLSEWSKARALAVDDAPCVLTGHEDWGGARDGSFGVAARVSEGRLVLALRIRDDVLVYGEDAVEVELDGRTWLVPMQAAGAIEGIEGLNGAFTNAVDFGTGLELSLPLPPRPDEHTPLPLVVRYIDEDPDEMPTTLATAPSMRALAVRVR